MSIEKYRESLKEKMVTLRKQGKFDEAHKEIEKERKTVSYKLINLMKKKLMKSDVYKKLKKEEILALDNILSLYEEAKEEPLNVISRKDRWAAEPKVGGKITYDDVPEKDLAEHYDDITIHHSWNKKNYPTMKEIQEEQMKWGYADIAYNFGIDVQGNIYEGRPLTKVQAHTNITKRHERWLIGIVLLSDLDTENLWVNNIFELLAEKIFWDGHFSDKTIKSLFQLVMYLHKTYGIDFIKGHDEYLEGEQKKKKWCPWDKWMLLVELVKMIQNES